ncbi:GntR family transcriptional regulator [Neobacillus jeddahensis]|uniref:GntR family transcriptional regulator n=1 Tax=Neobacillus jeddahensis TaxID=1461580 RepID=UPI0005A8392C|nr:GntR family transcriptional regulator [Neobacillus jeddahensis]
MNLAEKAYIELEEMIITLKLNPGQLISENEISQMLGIGRMPVREAIKRLEMAHLVRVLPHRGIMVTEIKTEEIFLQMELRRVLEALIVKRATKFSLPIERTKFLKLADAYETATIENDDIKAVRIDDEFNKFLAKCSRNPFAANALTPLHALARRMYFFQYKLNMELTKEINEGHVKLMRAVASGDESIALQALEDLLFSTEKLYEINIDTWYSMGN